jgi:hypothetical protein
MNVQVSGSDNDPQEQINFSNSFDEELDANDESKGKIFCSYFVFQFNYLN